jgi:hypothetical protein
MNIQALRFLYFRDCSNIPRRGRFVLSRGAQTEKPVQIGPLQNAFLVHVGAEKSGAERL